MNIKTKQNQILFSLITLLSGFCGIFFETLSNKVFSYFFGVTLISTTITVVIFFIGLALGSFYFPRIIKKSNTPIFHYLCIEVLLTLFLLFYPTFYHIGFLLLNWGIEYGQVVYFILRTLIIIILLMVPAFLMGGTVPFLFNIVSNFYNRDTYLPYYYGLNTLGAAIGVVVSSYFLFPTIGLEQSAYFAGTLNLSIVILLFFHIKKSKEGFSIPILTSVNINNLVSSLHDIKIKRIDSLYFLISFLSGVFVFSMEIVWFNLLALIIGNSVYAFAIMLATILIGIGLGSYLISKILIKNKLKYFQVIQLLLSLCLFISLFFWDKLGTIFTTVGLFNPGFWIMEATRFASAFILLIIPCLLIGASFPLLLQIYNKINSNPADTVGRLYAWNSLGSAVGIILGCFVFINFLGNQKSLNLIATIPLILIFLTFILDRKLKIKWILLLTSFALLQFIFSPKWNILEMTGGQNIYFSKGNSVDDKILYHKESSYSGAITLIDKNGIKTLYTNGKFEGNNSTEILDQYLFSIIPALFSTHYELAANLGLGVGGSLGAITQFPYKQIDLVEISPDIIQVADKHFKSINFNSIQNKKVKIHLQDGRIHFMKNKNMYNLITMESSSIWFAGSGNLYSNEFYNIIHNSLKTGGVFQQWIQLHHISILDIVRIIKTFKNTFNNPTLWIMGHQAILVAKKNKKINIDYNKLLKLEQNKNISSLLKKIGYNSIFQIFNHFILSSNNITKLIKNIESNFNSPLLIHEDMNPILEFSTPRNNSSQNVYNKNRKILFNYKWFDPKKLILNIPNQSIYNQIVKHIYFDTYDNFFGE